MNNTALVAYCLDYDFVRRLRSFCNELKPDFFLVGETLHGDYNQLINDEMLQQYVAERIDVT